MTPEDYFRKKLFDQKQQGIFGAMKDSDPSRVSVGSQSGTLQGSPSIEDLREPDNTIHLQDIQNAIGETPKSPFQQSLENIQNSQNILNQGGIPKPTILGGVMSTPPPEHHGIKDRLASIGKGILLGMGKQAQANPQSTGAQLLGAGAAGGIGGGIRPVTIDRMQAEAALRRQEAQAQTQIGMAHQAALAQSEGMRPLLEQAAIQQRINAAAQTSADRAARNAIAQRRNEIEMEKAKKPPAPGAPHTFTNADGTVSQWNADKQQWEKQPSLQGQSKGGLTPYQTTELKQKAAERESKRQSLLTESESEKAQADQIDEQLRGKSSPSPNIPGVALKVPVRTGGLYAQRAELQSAVNNDSTDVGKRQQLTAINTRIGQLEQGRNTHYANAGKLKAQAGAFEPLPGAQGQKPSGAFDESRATEAFKNAHGRAPSRAELQAMEAEYNRRSQ